jgi:hypothetical protein
MAATHEHPPKAPGVMTIGRDVGPAGRWIRVVAGLLALSTGVAGLVSGDTTNTQIAYTAGFFVLLAGYFLILHRVLGERLFARANPWFGTVIVIGSVGVFTAPFMPAALHDAAGLYIGATLVLAAAISYGGCEVAALPTLLTGRRYVLYCPINAVDAAERPLHAVSTRFTGWMAIGLTAIVGVYFLLGRDVLAALDLPDPVGRWWALVLLVPAALLAVHARTAAVRAEPAPTETRVFVIGAVVLAGLALYFAELVPQHLAWPAVLLGGLCYATAKAIATERRRRREASDG